MVSLVQMQEAEEIQQGKVNNWPTGYTKCSAVPSQSELLIDSAV